MLILISAVTQPLVFAHLNGFTVLGMHAPPRSRASSMAWAQSLLALLGQALTYAFMVGQYLSGARLFTAAVVRAPNERVVKSARARTALLAAGIGWAWCTMAALKGTPVADAAARAVLATQSFVGPTPQLVSTIQVGGGTPLGFLSGASAPAELMQRPVLSTLAAAGQHALASSLATERDIIEFIGTLSEDWLQVCVTMTSASTGRCSKALRNHTAKRQGEGERAVEPFPFLTTNQHISSQLR